MANWKIVRKADNEIVQSYESDKKEQRTGKFGGPIDDPEVHAHLKVPDGVDPNGVAVVDDDTPSKASAVYEGVTYSAQNTGFEGNNISLVFDGSTSIADVVAAWNAANPSNTVEHDAGDDTVQPSGGTVNLSGGDAGGLRLVEDSATLLAYQKEENRKARAAEIANQEKISEDAIATALSNRKKETQLMFAVNNLFEYLKGLQEAAGIDTASMSQAAQDGRQGLVDMQTNMLSPVLSAMSTRDAAVQDFVANNLPHPAAGLPDDVDDYYSNL